MPLTSYIPLHSAIDPSSQASRRHAEMAALLERLGMLRSSIWEPPTTLDHFIASPLQFLLSRIYYLLLFLRDPWPRRARRAGVPPIRIVCVSDTHDRTVPLPPGDLLVHAGDLTDNGTVAASTRQPFPPWMCR